MDITLKNLLVVLATAFAAGIWYAGLYGIYLPFFYFMGLVAAGAVVYLTHTRPNSACLAYVFVALFFVAGSIRYVHAVSIPASDISFFVDQSVALSGRIVTVAQLPGNEEDDKIRYVVEVFQLTKLKAGKETVMPVTGNIIMNIRQDRLQTKAGLGDRISVTGTVVGLHGYNNPGAINTVTALKREGITARLLPSGTVKVDSLTDELIPWKTWIENWRQQIVAAMERVMPKSDAAILAGMVFGGYYGVSRQVITDFQTTGLVHILSVSGTHIALVSAVVLWMGKRFKIRQQIMIALAAMAIMGYAVIAGLTSPVLRSVIMGLTGLTAVVWKRDQDTSAAFGFSLFLMLAYQPELIYDLSFQLSFGCTAGLIYFYSKTAAVLVFLPKRVAQAIAATFAAQLGALPFVAWYFSNYSISSFASNLIVVPLVEGVVMLGLSGMLLSSFVTALSNLVFVVCSLLLGLVLDLTACLAAMPAASIYIPPLNEVTGVVYYAFLFWVYGYFPRPVMLPLEIWKRWPGAVNTFFVVAALVLAVYINYPRPVVVHFIDVGQGDAALITTPHGHAIMVDTGGTMGNSSFDIGEQIVYPYLKHYGVAELDYLFLTHGHQDHAGGAAAIMNHVPVKCVLMAQEAEYTPAEKAVLHHKNRKAVIPQHQGQMIELDGVTFTVVYAPPANKHTGESNETSTVIRVSFGKQSILFTGDLEAPGEAELVVEDPSIRSNVLKVGHHGSRTSSTAGFLQAVSPEFAIISVGYHNKFGHPHRETLERLATSKAKVYRTDQSGAVRFITDGQTMTVEPYLQYE